MSVAPRVLVIDDEEEMREVLSRMLASLGCDPVSAASAEEAVGAFVKGTFDLITLDHRMPGLRGMDLHKLLSQEFGAGKRTTGFVPRKLPPILVITGYAEDPEIVDGQWGEGIVGVLQKPVTIAELRRIVEDLLGVRSEAPREEG
jgi:CheY-like chemotaxis protein